MSIMLPDALVTLLNQLGIKWPEGDEGKVFEYARRWQQMGEQVRDVRNEADASARRVLEANSGESAEAYRKNVVALDGPSRTASRTATGLQIGGGVLVVAAAAILALKVYAIIQLVIELVKEIQAYATAATTFGASLAQIPIWRALTKAAIEAFIAKTISTVEGNE